MAEVTTGGPAVYVVTCQTGTLKDSVKAQMESVLGKIAWMEYGPEYSGSYTHPSIQMFQPTESANALMSSMTEMLEKMTK